jgi:hypothetical protein
MSTKTALMVMAKLLPREIAKCVMDFAFYRIETLTAQRLSLVGTYIRSGRLNVYHPSMFAFCTEPAHQFQAEFCMHCGDYAMHVEFLHYFPAKIVCYRNSTGKCGPDVDETEQVEYTDEAADEW